MRILQSDHVFKEPLILSISVMFTWGHITSAFPAYEIPLTSTQEGFVVSPKEITSLTGIFDWTLI